MTERSAPAWVFFALTFAWSWSLWGIAVASGRPWIEFPTVVLYVLGGLGPSLAAVVLVHLGYGGERPAEFWRRVFEVRRISPAWYLAIAAVAFAPSLLARLAPTGMEAPAQGAAVNLGPAILVVAVGAGFAEELGWRGYALDRLVTRHGALVASLIVGAAWTLWHLPFYFMEGTIQHQAGLWSPDFWSDMVTRLPLAVLFAWIYLNTGRSILSAVALHALDNVASVMISPEGIQLLVRLALVTGLAVAVALIWSATTLTRSPAGVRPTGSAAIRRRT